MHKTPDNLLTFSSGAECEDAKVRVRASGLSLEFLSKTQTNVSIKQNSPRASGYVDEASNMLPLQKLKIKKKEKKTTNLSA